MNPLQPNSFYQKNPETELLANRAIVYAPSQEVILKKGLEITNKELRALYFFLYQTGARISEALKVRYNDISIKSIERKRYVEVRLFTLKNRKQKIRTIAIPLYIPMELQMYQFFDTIYQHRIDLIFKEVGSRNNVWDKLSKIVFNNIEVLDIKTGKVEQKDIRLHPHLLRHFRLTHLIQLYNYTPFELQQFAGWSSIQPASIYVSLNATDLARRFMEFNYTKQKYKIQ